MKDTMNKSKVLFLCTGNSARSQMAEAFLRAYAGDRFEAYSAGLQPKPIHPLTRQVMNEIGFELEGQRAKDVTEYLGKVHFGYLITVCDEAERNCPKTFPGLGARMHWSLDDPAAFEGTGDERLAVFRRVRDEIRERVRTWVGRLEGDAV
jgi:arsenate reductase (thioredoxin)